MGRRWVVAMLIVMVIMVVKVLLRDSCSLCRVVIPMVLLNHLTMSGLVVDSKRLKGFHLDFLHLMVVMVLGSMDSIMDMGTLTILLEDRLVGENSPLATASME